MQQPWKGIYLEYSQNLEATTPNQYIASIASNKHFSYICM